MAPIPMIYRLLLVFLVGQGLGYIQPASASLIVFSSRPVFLAAASIEVTQDFESFASPTPFFTPIVTFDAVTFSATPSPSAWFIDNSVGSVRTNTLGTSGIVRHEIGFGEDRFVNAFGFTFLGGGSVNGVAARYDITVSETDGSATTLALAPLAPVYFGLVSNTGIETISVDPVSNTAGATIFWRYDDFSRSSISAVPEPSPAHLSLIGAIALLTYFAVQRCRRRRVRSVPLSMSNGIRIHDC